MNGGAKSKQNNNGAVTIDRFNPTLDFGVIWIKQAAAELGQAQDPLNCNIKEHFRTW